VVGDDDDPRPGVELAQLPDQLQATALAGQRLDDGIGELRLRGHGQRRLRAAHGGHGEPPRRQGPLKAGAGGRPALDQQ